MRLFSSSWAPQGTGLGKGPRGGSGHLSAVPPAASWYSFGITAIAQCRRPPPNEASCLPSLYVSGSVCAPLRRLRFGGGPSCACTVPLPCHAPPPPPTCLPRSRWNRGPFHSWAPSGAARAMPPPRHVSPWLRPSLRLQPPPFAHFARHPVCAPCVCGCVLSARGLLRLSPWFAFLCSLLPLASAPPSVCVVARRSRPRFFAPPPPSRCCGHAPVVPWRRTGCLPFWIHGSPPPRPLTAHWVILLHYHSPFASTKAWTGQAKVHQTDFSTWHTHTSKT